MRARLFHLVLGATALVSLPFWGRALVLRLSAAWSQPLTATRGETLRRMEGERYEAEMDRIREAVPPGGTYGLVGSRDRPRTKWIRYELAPRRAWYAADHAGDRWVFRKVPAPAPLPEWTVLAGDPGEPPRLVPTAELSAHGLPPDPRLENLDLACWLDAPAEGALVHAPFPIRGWCQEGAGTACRAVLAFVDGNRVGGAASRSPRPDVCGAFPRLAPCGEAGFEIAAPLLPAGEHEMTVLFVSASGRWRRLGPRRFRSAP